MHVAAFLCRRVGEGHPPDVEEMGIARVPASDRKDNYRSMYLCAWVTGTVADHGKHTAEFDLVNGFGSPAKLWNQPFTIAPRSYTHLLTKRIEFSLGPGDYSLRAIVDGTEVYSGPFRIEQPATRRG